MIAGGGGKRPRHGRINKNFSWRKTPEKFFACECSFGFCVIQILEYILWALMQINGKMEKNLPESQFVKFMESKLDIFE